MQLNSAQVGASPVGSRTWGKAMACAPGLSNTMLIGWEEEEQGSKLKGPPELMGNNRKGKLWCTWGNPDGQSAARQPS